MKIRRWIGNILLLLGVTALAVAGGAIATNAIWQGWANWVFDRETHGEPATIAAYLFEKRDRVTASVRTWLGLPVNPKPPAPHPAPPLVIDNRIENNTLIGRLTIPRLHLSTMVREGDGAETLSLAAGHIPSTALPGQHGNVGVAGHRDTLFRGLREIRKDDEIRFETLAGTYVYQVASTQIVKPTNVSVLKADGFPELTLVTCYPFYYVGSAPDRFIVKARQISGTPLEPSLSATRQETAPADRIASSPNIVKRDPVVRPAIKRVGFSVSRNHSLELAPGISLGVTRTDASLHRVDGWMWLMPDRRTILLRGQAARVPVVFYGHRDGRKRELLITSVTKTSVTGYLLLPE